VIGGDAYDGPPTQCRWLTRITNSLGSFDCNSELELHSLSFVGGGGGGQTFASVGEEEGPSFLQWEFHLRRWHFRGWLCCLPRSNTHYLIPCHAVLLL
jgi:hypothetical protein